MSMHMGNMTFDVSSDEEKPLEHDTRTILNMTQETDNNKQGKEADSSASKEQDAKSNTKSRNNTEVLQEPQAPTSEVPAKEKKKRKKKKKDKQKGSTEEPQVKVDVNSSATTNPFDSASTKKVKRRMSESDNPYVLNASRTPPPTRTPPSPTPTGSVPTDTLDPMAPPLELGRVKIVTDRAAWQSEEVTLVSPKTSARVSTDNLRLIDLESTAGFEDIGIPMAYDSAAPLQTYRIRTDPKKFCGICYRTEPSREAVIEPRALALNGELVKGRMVLPGWLQIDKEANNHGHEGERWLPAFLEEDQKTRILYEFTEHVIVYCRTHRSKKVAVGGTAVATGAAAAGACLIAPWTLPFFAVSMAGNLAGSVATSYVVAPGVARLDFDTYEAANEEFRKISSYKIMIRDNKIAQSSGKIRWVCELAGVAFKTGGLDRLNPLGGKQYNILRAPVAWGKTHMNPFRSFDIKQYATTELERAEEKWANMSKMNAAIMMDGHQIWKTYGLESYVNELLGWLVTRRAVLEDLDELADDSETLNSDGDIE